MVWTAATKALFGVALLVGLAYAYSAYEVHRVTREEARFMEPAVRPQKVRIFGTDGELPQRGAIVWYAPPSGEEPRLLSRVIALPGERVEIRDGVVVVDGEPLAEPYAREQDPSDRIPELQVPAWHVWVLNDRRRARGSAFADSRALGPIPLGRIYGALASGAETEGVR